MVGEVYMLYLKFSDGNNNSEFLANILDEIIAKFSNVNWSITKLDIVPKYKGDYDGFGISTFDELAYKFEDKVRREKVVITTHETLLNILLDSRTVYQGIFACIHGDGRELSLGSNNGSNIIQNGQVIAILSILDGDLIAINSNNEDLLITLKVKFSKYISRF